MQKYYRKPWTKEKVESLIKWWPHFGTYGMAELLNISRKQIKAKVNKLKLTLLSKTQRLCFECKNNFQKSRSHGLYCRECHLAKRKYKRVSKDRPMKQWMQECLNTTKYRSIEPSNLSIEYLIDLWTQQNGQCVYSGIPMEQPKYGSGRRPFVASLDRIDSSKGYVKNNVVWCCWVCNAGKQCLNISDYLKVSALVARRQQETLKFVHDIQASL